MLAQAMIINAVVLFVVLESDVGPHRKITRFRVIRPLVSACLIVPFFIKGLATTGIGARAAFSYGSIHWFGPPLDRWMANNSITSSAITDGLIFMAVGMLLTRVIAMGVRAKNLSAHAVST